MATEKQSLLNAVNVLLSNIGQSPVTSLETPNPMVDLAQSVIGEVNRSVQSEGWVFNTELNIPTPESSEADHYPRQCSVY